MRKPARAPSYEDYFNSNKHAEQLAQIIRAHLAIEAVLIEIIHLREPGDAVYALKFPAKTDKCVKLGMISAAQKDALDAINALRNDVAHILGHKLTADDVFALLEKVGRSGFDFSDDAIWKSRAWFDENYGIDEGLWEVFHNVFNDLASSLHDAGGPAYF